MTQYKFAKEYAAILEKKGQNIQATLAQKQQNLQAAAANFQQQIQQKRERRKQQPLDETLYGAALQPLRPFCWRSMFSTTMSKMSPSEAQYSSTLHGMLVWKWTLIRLSSPTASRQSPGMFCVM